MIDSGNHINPLAILGICSGFSGLCGGLSYLLKVEEGKPFKWGEFVLHSGISAVFGACAYSILDYYGVPAQVSGAICGMAGWMGTRGIRLVEVLVIKRSGVSPEELKK